MTCINMFFLCTNFRCNIKKNEPTNSTEPQENNAANDEDSKEKSKSESIAYVQQVGV